LLHYEDSVTNYNIHNKKLYDWNPMQQKSELMSTAWNSGLWNQPTY